MSTLKVNRIEPRTGDTVEIVGFEAPTTPVKAWVNFNGTGVVAIRDEMNVSSITDNGAGDYTVNFETAFPDNNYCFLVSGDGASNAARTGSLIGGGVAVPLGLSYAQAVQTNLLRVTTRENSAAGFDYTSVTVAILGA